MTGTQIQYSTEEISVWLRGLLTIAWADGDFDEHERAVIADLAHSEWDPQLDLNLLQPITPDELATVLRKNHHAAENFLRTAVMVAIADGTYSSPEDNMLQQFCEVLGQNSQILNSLRHTLADSSESTTHPLADHSTHNGHGLEPLHPVKEWLDHLEIHDPSVAKFLCKMIPAQCPFERDVTLFGHKLVHIPPLCKLNPLYEQMVGLRFRALSYLADKCGEDVSEYC